MSKPSNKKDYWSYLGTNFPHWIVAVATSKTDIQLHFDRPAMAELGFQGEEIPIPEKCYDDDDDVHKIVISGPLNKLINTEVCLCCLNR